MTTDRQALYDELLPTLDRPKGPDGSGRVWSYCPAHPDGQKHGRRSLSLSPRYGLDCFAGCTEGPGFSQVLELLRGRPSVMPISVRSARSIPLDQLTLVQVWGYCTAEGVLVAEKGRFAKADGSKTYKIRRSPEDTAWRAGIAPLKPHDVPLYYAQAIALADADTPVYFVEGEKAADACIQHGLLATTNFGGSSQTEFGDALEDLRGRDVRLWPDNDAPGRKLMALLHARLTGIARTVRIVECPIKLDEKGDAFDFFLLGGTVADLEGGTLKAPTVEFLEDEALRVRIPTAKGIVTFTFEDISSTTRAFDCELTVSVGDSQDLPYAQRLNLLSSSARTELRRDLESLLGKEGFGWTKTTNDALSLARESYKTRDRGINYASMLAGPENMDHMLMDPLLPSFAPTILFGDGSAGKTFVALSMAICIVTGYPFLGRIAPKQPVLFVDYEGSQEAFRRRVERLAAGMGLSTVDGLYYWPARGIPLVEQIAALRDKVRRDGIGLVIVDSAAPAVGGDPNDAKLAITYFNGLARLGCATLTLAHITKGNLVKNVDGEVKKEKDTEKPFGSVFWSNEARRTWYVERVQDEDSAVVDVGLYCRKVNDGRKPLPIALRMTYEDPSGPVRVELASVEATPELVALRPAVDRVKIALRGGPKTIYELAAATGMNNSNIENVFRRHGQLFEERGSFGKAKLWALKGSSVTSVTPPSGVTEDRGSSAGNNADKQNERPTLL